MAVQLLREGPASPASSLGPFQARDFLATPDSHRPLVLRHLNFDLEASWAEVSGLLP